MCAGSLKLWELYLESPWKVTEFDVSEVWEHSKRGLDIIVFMNHFHPKQISLLGVFVFSPTPTNVTVMFPSGAGVEVRERDGDLTTTVLLPEEFENATLGLLGKMNCYAEDDLALSNGERVRNQSNPEELFTFGASCETLLRT